MKAKITLFLLPAALCLAQENNAAPKNELAFGLGELPSFSRSNSPTLDVGPGVALQVNYGRRFLSSRHVALYGEINFVASPTAREITTSLNTATHDFASLYITPGIRVNFRPASRISPYALVGGGYADYEQSLTRIDGGRNPAPRELSRGVFDFGAGIDVHVWRFVALRGEARDFYTGSPNYNISSVSGGQHNIVATGAFVLRWH